LLALRCFLAGRGDAGETVVVSFVAVEADGRDRFAGRDDLLIEVSP
jgi:hypothetical protein